jgi:hypothetical protein
MKKIKIALMSDKHFMAKENTFISDGQLVHGDADDTNSDKMTYRYWRFLSCPN